MWQRLSVFCYHYTYWCHMTHERVCFTTTCTLCQLKYKSCNVCAAQLAGVIVGRMSSASSCFGDLECHCARATALSHARPQSSAYFLHAVYTAQPVVSTHPVVQPVGWTMQMSAAKRRLSGPARTLMTSLGWRAQQGQMHGFLFSCSRQLAPKSTPAKCTVSCSFVFASWRQRVLPSCVDSRRCGAFDLHCESNKNKTPNSCP